MLIFSKNDRPEYEHECCAKIFAVQFYQLTWNWINCEVLNLQHTERGKQATFIFTQAGKKVCVIVCSCLPKKWKVSWQKLFKSCKKSSCPALKVCHFKKDDPLGLTSTCWFWAVLHCKWWKKSVKKWGQSEWITFDFAHNFGTTFLLLPGLFDK